MAKQSSEHRALAIGLPRDRRFVMGLLVSALQGLSAVALLATSGWLISRAAEQPPVMYLMLGTVGVRAFALGRAGFRYAERIVLHDASFRLQSKIRPRIFQSLVPFAPSGFGSKGYGEKVSTLVNDVDELQGLSIRVLSPLMQAATVSLAAAFFVWALAPSAAWALVATLLGAFFIAFPVSAMISRWADVSVAETKANLHLQTIEALDSLDVLIAFDWLDDKLASLAEVDDRLSRISNRAAWSAGFGQAWVSVLSLIATLSVAYLAAIEVSSGQLPGVALAVLALVPIAVFDLVSSAQPALSAWRRYRVSAQRVFDVIEAPVPRELAIDDEASEVLDHFNALELKDVSITYPGERKPAAGGINLRIEPGDRILISGESGSGKSTVARALLRLIDVSAGEYRINGRTASEFMATSVRRHIGMVEQSPTIFLGSVRANLLLAKPDASDDELEQVLQRVGLQDTFAKRNGLDTEVGERGLLVSGGEAQRLGLARALLANFDVIIFDEPTANVEAKLAEGLLADLVQIATNAGSNAKRSDNGRAIVVISHDPRIEGLFNKLLKISRMKVS